MDEKSCKTIFSSEKMDWETPKELFDKLNKEFCFTVDAAALPTNAKCPRFWSPAEDGLQQNWGGEKVFCNPPYGRDCWRWIQKGCMESEKPDTVVVMLIAARTSNSEWHDYIFSHAKEVRFIRGRLKFGTQNRTASSAPFPSAVVVFQAHTGKCELKTM